MWEAALVEELRQVLLALPAGEERVADGYPLTAVPPDALDPLIAWLQAPRSFYFQGQLAYRFRQTHDRQAGAPPGDFGRTLARRREAGQVVYLVRDALAPHDPHGIALADRAGRIDAGDYLTDPPDHGWVEAGGFPLRDARAVAAGWLRRPELPAPPGDRSTGGFLPHPPEPPERPEDFLRVVAVPLARTGLLVLQPAEPEQLHALRRYLAAQG